jgi:hypothetical protein
MTTFEWAMVSISLGGFILTSGGVLGSCIWAVAKIRQNTLVLIAQERIERAEAVAKALKRFDEAQRIQDHNFGEVGLSLRRFIEEVEKEMHAIEMWARDHYALKEDVKDIRDDIKEMRSEIKSDLAALGKKIDNNQ